MPWPPSVNRYWRHVGGKTLLSAQGRAYSARACAGLVQQKPQEFARFDAPVAATLHFHEPDRRKRDLDNCLKAIFDCLTKAGVWKDDSLVHEFHAFRAAIVKDGLVEVAIRLLG